jgi:uncharacterized protein YjbI with pentapeptide repeats
VKEQRRIRDLQDQLIREAGSRVNITALTAIDMINKRGWLQGDNGILQGADLRHTNLENADLLAANLQNARLSKANLQDAELLLANLQDANMSGANLQDVDMAQANLQCTDLIVANLQGAYLDGANLQGANLTNTDFNEDTTLPDATKWTPGTDMTRFTDPDHPEFWRGYGLRGADLQNQNFVAANLQGVSLHRADLQGANMSRANLRGAVLSHANLRGVDLRKVDLGGANLPNADLRGALLHNATFNEETTLPDGRKWTPDTDMNRFTDPEHPNFWRSNFPSSPAYKGDDA